MLTNDYRPRTFGQVVGQPIPVEVLKSVVKAPDVAPKVFVFRGAFGTGKTTSARILAKALNCEFGKIEPCGDCPFCDQDMTFSPFYQEFDSSEVGSKEDIQSLRDDFFMSSQACRWRVIVLDEFHLASRQAQSALLKILEGTPENLFVIFCTTDVEKIIPTIRSRAVDLVFQKAPVEEIRRNLMRVVAAENIELDEEILSRICLYSRGHLRDSVMLLDVYQSMGSKEVFLKQISSSELDLLCLLCAIRQGDTDTVRESLGQVLKAPLDILRGDLYKVIQEALKVYATEEAGSIYQRQYEALVDLYRGDLLKLLGFTMSEWAVNSFRSDETVQAFFWAAFITFRFRKSQEVSSTKEDKFRRRGSEG